VTILGGAHFLFQVFVQIANQQLVMASGSKDQLDNVRTLITAIAATIEPEKVKNANAHEPIDIT